MRDQNQTCSTCAYWTGDKRKKEGQGECRRMPIAVAGVVPMQNAITRQTQPGIMSGWPTSQPHHWCGEHRPELLS